RGFFFCLSEGLQHCVFGQFTHNAKRPGSLRNYLRVFSSESAAWFLSRFAIFFSLAVFAAGFLAAFWPRSLDMRYVLPVGGACAPEADLIVIACEPNRLWSSSETMFDLACSCTRRNPLTL